MPHFPPMSWQLLVVPSLLVLWSSCSLMLRTAGDGLMVVCCLHSCSLCAHSPLVIHQVFLFDLQLENSVRRNLHRRISPAQIVWKYQQCKTVLFSNGKVVSIGIQFMFIISSWVTLLLTLAIFNTKTEYKNIIWNYTNITLSSLLLRSLIAEIFYLA